MDSPSSPQDQLTGWLDVIDAYTPTMYLLAALPSLLYGGWQWKPLMQGSLAIVGVGFVKMSLALATLRGRVQKGIVPPLSTSPLSQRWEKGLFMNIVA